MEKENYIQKRSIPFFVGLLLVIAFAASFAPFVKPLNLDVIKYPMLIYFFGINLILVVIGSFFLSFYLIKLWIISFDQANKFKEKEIDNLLRVKMQELLNEDADKRRIYEQGRNQINDLFRLIELAKDTLEEINEKSEVDENKTMPKHTEINKVIKKNEGLNTDKLTGILNVYQILISKQEFKTK